MRFSKLAEYFESLEKTASRLEMTRILSGLFKKIDKDEIDKVLYLLQGRVTPLYERADFGIAEKMLIKAIIQSMQVEKKDFISLYHKLGDLGLAVEQIRKGVITIEEKDISISEVYEKLFNITKKTGDGSQEAKISIISNLIKTLDALSCKFLLRIPTNTLRLGFSDMTILDAFSWMLRADKSLRGEIERAYHVRPDLGFIGKKLKSSGISGLKNVLPAVFTPIIMMRAERLSDAKEILEKTGGKAPVEPKYDGFRLQIHVKKGKDTQIKLYSRNLDDVSFMYPDIVAGIAKQIQKKEVIFEGEAIGFEPLTKNFLPFQETVQRKRKYNIDQKAKEIPLKLFAFDILYVDGESLLTQHFSTRREYLLKAIKKINPSEDTVLVAENKIVKNAHDLELEFNDAVSKGLEGIVVKKLDGIYQPGARGWNWIKYKKSYSSKIDDTLDCLVMGYDLGLGKRVGFGIGAFLVGVYDPKDDKFKSVAKIGTGLSDEEWKSLKSRCEKAKTSKMPPLYDVDQMMDADIWISPAIVVEIRADEITKSPVHTAGRVMRKTKTGKAMEVDQAGFALRFPRLEKFREDRRPEDVTTLAEVAKMYKSQKK